MATSMDNYPNSYDYMAIEPIVKVLEKYFLSIEWFYDYEKSALEDKKEALEEIALEIDNVLRAD